MVRASTQGERLAMSAILRGNFSHFTVQYGPYYRVKWLRLKSRDTWFTRPLSAGKSTCSPVYVSIVN